MDDDSFSRKVLSKREQREKDLRDFERQTEEADEEIKQWSRGRQMPPEFEDRIQKGRSHDNNNENTNALNRQYPTAQFNQFNEESIALKLSNIRSLLGIEGQMETKETGKSRDQAQYSMYLSKTFGKDAQEYHPGTQQQTTELKGNEQGDSSLGEFKIDTRRFLNEYIDNCEEILNVSNSDQKQYEQQLQKPRDLNNLEGRSNYIQTDQVCNNQARPNLASHSSQSSIVNNFNYTSYPQNSYQAQFSQLDNQLSPNMMLANKNPGQFFNYNSNMDIMTQGIRNPVGNSQNSTTHIQNQTVQEGDYYKPQRRNTDSMEQPNFYLTNKYPGIHKMNTIHGDTPSMNEFANQDKMNFYQENVNTQQNINQSQAIQKKEGHSSSQQRQNRSQHQNNTVIQNTIEPVNLKQNNLSLRSFSQHSSYKLDTSAAAQLRTDQNLNDNTRTNYNNNEYNREEPKYDVKKRENSNKRELSPFNQREQSPFELRQSSPFKLRESSPFKLRESSPFKATSPDKSILSYIAQEKQNQSLVNQSQSRIQQNQRESIRMAQKNTQNTNITHNVADNDEVGDSEMFLYTTDNDFHLNEQTIPKNNQDRQRNGRDNNGSFQKDQNDKQEKTMNNSRSLNENNILGKKENVRQMSIKEGQHRLLQDREDQEDSKSSTKQNNSNLAETLNVMNEKLKYNECFKNTKILNSLNSGCQNIPCNQNESLKQGYETLQNEWSGLCLSNGQTEGNLKRRLELAIEESSLNWKDQVEELQQRVKEQEQEISIRINQERASRQRLNQQLNEGFLREDQLRTQLDFQKKEIDSMRFNRDFIQGASNQEVKMKLLEMETDLHITRGQCQSLAFEKSLLEQQIEQMQQEHRSALKNVEIELEQEHSQELKTLNHAIKSLRSFNCQIIEEIGVKPKLKPKEKVDTIEKTNAKEVKGGDPQKPKKRLSAKASHEQGQNEKNEGSGCDCEKLRNQLRELREEIDVLRDEAFRANEEKRWADVRLRKQTFLECRVERIVQERRELHMQEQMLFWKKTCGQILAGVLRECQDVKKENVKLKNELLSSNQKFLAQQQHSIQAQLQEEFQMQQQSHLTIKELQSKYNTAQARLAGARTKIKQEHNTIIQAQTSNKNVTSNPDYSVTFSKYQFNKQSK